MRTQSLIIRAVWLALFLGACSLSIDVGDPTSRPAATSSPTSLLPTLTLEPGATAGATPSSLPLSPTSDLPWAGRGLSGRLLMLTNPSGPTKLTELDLSTGEQSTLYEFPTGSMVASAEVSPDGKEILLAYVPPDPSGEQLVGYWALYLMPSDGSAEPRAFLDRSEQEESLFYPTWSPNGDYIYYSRLVTIEGASQITVERVAYPDGAPEMLVGDAFWARVSPDGSQIVYVTWDLASGADLNELYTADADGKNAMPAIPAGDYPLVDAPMFSPDGSVILFSAPEPVASTSLSWLDRLLGVRVARAHNVPSDWYVVSASGGVPQRITNLLTTALYGEYAPDGGQIASIFVAGLFIMNPDGSEMQFIALDFIPYGTLDWVP